LDRYQYGVEKMLEACERLDANVQANLWGACSNGPTTWRECSGVRTLWFVKKIKTGGLEG